MQTSTRTVIAVFDDQATADRVVNRLIENGFSRNEIDVTGHHDYAGESASGNIGLTGRSPADASGGGISGFFRRLFGSDDDREHRKYAEAVRRGGVLVCVNTDDGDRQDRAADIMDEGGAVDIDRRAASWKERGYSDYDPAAAPYTEDEVTREREYYRNDRGEQRIPVVQEELSVGKRPVQRGGVRIYNRVHQEPVEKQVNLREERVRVDRRPSDRAASQADIDAHDEVIEVREMAEEPVVEKRTRVVEEVVVNKEANERTETVRDKVRRSDVKVEKVGAGDTHAAYEDDFRRDFQARYGSNRTAKYDTYAPAYQYGYRSASDERYRGKRWEDVEPTLRSDYEREYPRSKWEEMKDAVRYGWERVTGRR